MSRRVLLLLAALGLVLLPGASALAQGATSETFHEHGATDIESDVNPCSGVPGTVTITYNAVFHITQPASGGEHVTFTQTGSFAFVPDDPSEPSYTGHFAVWGGFNGNKKNAAGTFTFEGTGRGSDGSRISFHGVEHFNVTATGVEVSFSKFHC